MNIWIRTIVTGVCSENQEVTIVTAFVIAIMTIDILTRFHRYSPLYYDHEYSDIKSCFITFVYIYVVFDEESSLTIFGGGDICETISQKPSKAVS